MIVIVVVFPAGCEQSPPEPPPPSPAPAPALPERPAKLRSDAEGEAVTALQERLTELPTGTARPTGGSAGRQIDGWRDAPLGLLWRPKYFNGGIAVHGAPSVPPYPASHGCARVSIAAMTWLWKNDALPLKTTVWVY
ncbi:MAG TPA: L,D-transpeptidase [Actinoplanes sp.]|nr:L,D-transpeptidase [Actinoplanes sp.]